MQDHSKQVRQREAASRAALAAVAPTTAEVAPEKPELERVDRPDGGDWSETGQASWLQRLRAARGFLWSVVVPTLLAAVYLFVFAADRYESESKFVVRAPGGMLASQLAGLVQGNSFTRATDDSYVVNAYVLSRDSLRRLASEADLAAILGRASFDPLWRYPGLRRQNEESRYKHLKSLFDVRFDHTTGVSTLRVQAFDPEDARLMSEVLLRNAEQLINRLSERAQSDTLQTAREELELARQGALEAQRQLTEFRVQNAVVDPGKVAAAAQEVIGRLALERAQTSAQIIEVRQASPQSPQIDPLRLRIEALDGQIKKESEALAGASVSLAQQIATYESLMLEREFAERTFAAANATLEIARSDAQRQRLYLEHISGPSRPDTAAYPSRLVALVVVFLVLGALYTVVRWLIEDTMDHAGH